MLPAAADQDDALNVVVGGVVNYNSNVFASPDSANPQSDIIRSGYVGLRIDKPYAQQRFQLGVTQTAYRYQTFSELDYDTLNYQGTWLWHLSPRVSGALSASRLESLVPFADTLGNRRILTIAENRALSLDGWVSGPWHALLGISRSDVQTEQRFTSTPDFRSVSGNAGIQYIARSGSSLTVLRRTTKGEYINSPAFNPADFFASGNYRQNESELQANWNLTARSIVAGVLTWIERRNDQFIRGDFSGLAGNLNYSWTPTARLGLVFGAQRTLSPWQEFGSTYRADNTISFALSWQASAKIAARARLEHIQSYFYGGSVANANGLSYNNASRSALVGLDWSALRSLTIGTSLQYLQRSSDVALQEYDATVANINASLLF